jgi:hypothetical protein
MSAITNDVEGALRGAPTVPTLRAARAELVEAIAEGAVHLIGLHALVEDELIAAISRARREAER